MKKIVVASRESTLAVIQSNSLISYIKDNIPDMEVSILTMKTSGDMILDKSLDQVGGKGLFVRELDIALDNGKADVSVHSLKDMPMEISDRLPIVAFSKREDPRDVLVLPKGVSKLDPELPIGSSSLRRTLQLKALYPKCSVKPVRGNVQTRLKKLDEGECGALVLAAAGLIRLGLEDRISRYFSLDEMIPAAGQGIIAVQGRNGEDYSWLEGYNDADSRCAALCERAYVKALDGGCTSPVCAYARVDGDTLYMDALYYDEDSGEISRDSMKGDKNRPEQLGIRMAAYFMKSRGDYHI